MKSMPWWAAAAVALSTITLADAAPTDSCQEAKARDKRVVAETTDTRVLSAMAAVIEASGFRPRVVVCDVSLSYVTAVVGNLGTYYYVGVTKPLVELSTDDELRAALGHELAHIVLGHRKLGFELTHRRTAQYERDADALSARWFGNAPMRSLLEKLRVDATRLPRASQRRQGVAEINARIDALR